MWISQEQILNYEIFFDVDDDTRNETTTIEISMFDKDLFKSDIVDINPDPQKNSILLVFDHKTNAMSGYKEEAETQGILSYSIDLNPYVSSEIDDHMMIYNWQFNSVSHQMFLNISYEKYQWYLDRDINRTPQYVGKEEMKMFITSDDDSIKLLSDMLLNRASQYGYDEIETINFILAFVQQNIEYVDDSVSTNVSEYWKFPVETLIEGTGDCEDSSILFQSIIKNIGYDLVMIFYIIDDETGHLSTGVNINEPLEGYSVNYQKMDFFYCETTSNGYQLGEKPNDIPDEPELIIDLN